MFQSSFVVYLLLPRVFLSGVFLPERHDSTLTCLCSICVFPILLSLGFKLSEMFTKINKVLLVARIGTESCQLTRGNIVTSGPGKRKRPSWSVK